MKCEPSDPEPALEGLWCGPLPRLPVAGSWFAFLFRRSFRFVEDEVGVAVFELLGDLESLPGRVVEEESGDAVPEFASFFLEDLPLSLALESCSC